MFVLQKTATDLAEIEDKTTERAERDAAMQATPRELGGRVSEASGSARDKRTRQRQGLSLIHI